jgi:hypothetical protein
MYERIIAAIPALAVAALVAMVSYFFALCGEPREYWLWHNVLHLL